MITLLSKWLIPHRDQVDDPAVRQAYGTLCGIVGIALNLLLFAGKFFSGTISGSIAITADAFNNLSDAGSSVVTLIGFKLSGRKADTGHPFGHGRMEYLSGLIVAGLIIIMGIELGKSSLTKILHPAAVGFSLLSVGILAVSICVKVYMSIYNRRVGKKIHSAAMAATATDSLSDTAATTAVLIATLVAKWTGWQIDGWVGILVALVILYAGWRAAKETLDLLLGQPPEEAFVRQIIAIVMNHPHIIGMHDLVVHDYGPGRLMISLHAEVPAEGNIMELHDEIDNAERGLAEKLNCHAVIHMDPVITNDNGATAAVKEKVCRAVKDLDPHINIHDFRMVTGPTHTNVIFDAVVPFEFRMTNQETEEKIRAAVRGLDGNYFAVVNVENSFSEIL